MCHAEARGEFFATHWYWWCQVLDLWGPGYHQYEISSSHICLWVTVLQTDWYTACWKMVLHLPEYMELARVPGLTEEAAVVLGRESGPTQILYAFFQYRGTTLVLVLTGPLLRHW